MGKLECLRCGAIIEKPTFKEAQESLDHSVGLTRNRPCRNDGTQLVWNGIPVDPKNPPTHNKHAGPEMTATTAWPTSTSGSSTATSHQLTATSTQTEWPKPKHTKTTKPKKKR